MQELLRKIQANAAARLTLPAGKTSAKELARFKTFLKVETHRLKMLHRAGQGGIEICQARAAILDQLLQHLWANAKRNLSDQAQREFPKLTLVAIGGYGRGELNPHSDIDFMFLHSGQVAVNKPLPHFASIIDGTLYPLWDMGLKIGYSVRDITDCVKEANSDMQSRTSMIEARFVTGDESLFQKFESTILNKCVIGHEDKYIEMRLADQASRRAKFGNSACMQEPNVKNGCGGLRDYQNLLWMTFFKKRARTLRELQDHSLISESERKQLTAAYDFLLRVRTEMHYELDRPTDVLSKSLQPAVAHNLGYRERSPSKRIEGFMRDYYTHSRNIFLITRTLEQRLALQPQPSRLSLTAWLPGRRVQKIEPVDGFRFINGEIVASGPNVFREQPRRFMRVFLHAQQRGLRLHADLAQMIRNQLKLVDRSFLTDEHVRETFLTILNQRGNVAPVLRAMHEVGLLGKYMPEFGRMTCLVQHEFYHQYTADEHTLVCLEKLDRVWEAKEAMLKPYCEPFHRLERPFVLYLALLLHDVGKADSHGDHSKAGAELAMRAARRLDLDAVAKQSLRVVIANHLLLASVSQRRDLDDPAVIRHVARQVETPENLMMLTLHTLVDALATSDKLWNGFKDSLLWSVHLKTLRVLTGGTEGVRVEEQQREELKSEVKAALPDTLSEEELEAHFASLPPRYFVIHSPKDILDDLTIANQFMSQQIAEEETALAPVVSWVDDTDRGCSRVKICTWDRTGLFNKIAGSFSAAGLNILTAQIFSRTDGIVLDEFFATDARAGGPGTAEQREKFKEVLAQALMGAEVDFYPLIARQKNARPLYQAYTGERIQTRIQFDNEASDSRTVIEVETEDRLGLLYAVSSCLSGLALDIVGARISTEKGAAIDSFYVRERDGKKVLNHAQQKLIERHLVEAIRDLAPGNV
jgi:[protein-PII] uridylyltransferase